MMDKRAYYNLKRKHWLHDPTMVVDPWQVANYREFPLEVLLEYLDRFGVTLDRQSFIQLAQDFESPEEFTTALIAETQLIPDAQDYLYLIVFELWRRLVPEKRSLSVFCDELDYQINLYDNDSLETPEHLEDALASLQHLLEESVDKDEDPAAYFYSFQEGCANDLESFLYDFISERIDHENYSYASELLEGFIDYVSDPKWFDILEARLLISSDPEEANQKINQLIKESHGNNDLQYLLELLSLLVQEGEKESFLTVVQSIVLQLETEVDFQDLMLICEDYFHCLDAETEEQKVHRLLAEREHNDEETSFNIEDPAVQSLLNILEAYQPLPKTS